MKQGRAEFSPSDAITYAGLLRLVYQIYDRDPGNPTPAIPVLPDNLQFVAYVQMQDFFIKAGQYEFYGLIAQSQSDPGRFILVIRGTRGLMGWFDDLASIVLGPWQGPGQVGYGFNRIYSSLRIVPFHLEGPQPPAVLEPAPAETFAEQVSITVKAARVRQSAEATVYGAAPQEPTKVEVAGHSLGAALATLYAAQNAVPKTETGPVSDVVTPILYTFGSPRVGDPDFAAAFDELPVTSWRIVNLLDVVTELPYAGFAHVKEQQSYNSGFSTAWSIGCWHSIITYMNLVDPKVPIAKDCLPTVFEDLGPSSLQPPTTERRAASL